MLIGLCLKIFSKVGGCCVGFELFLMRLWSIVRLLLHLLISLPCFDEVVDSTFFVKETKLV